MVKESTGNKAIGDVKFIPKETMSEETKAKIGKANTGNKACLGRCGELHPMYGKTGTQGGNFKGTTVGVSVKDGTNVQFNGNVELKAAGFTVGAVSRCVNGKLKQHKGYTWTRETADEKV